MAGKKVVRYVHRNGVSYTVDYAPIGKKNVETVIADLLTDSKLLGVQNNFDVGKLDGKGSPEQDSFEPVRAEEMDEAMEIVAERLDQAKDEEE